MIFCSPQSLDAQSDEEVVLRRVLVYGSEEDALDTQPWQLSSHTVFRRITENAAAALEQMRPPACCTPLPSLLEWLESYKGLFTEPCATTGRLLELHSSLHGFLPPTQRSHHGYQASH